MTPTDHELLTSLRNLAARQREEALQASLDQLHGAPFSDRVYLALKSRAETAELALRRWRDWAQFVWLGGGPARGTDAELREAVCAAAEAEEGARAQTAEARVQQLEAALQAHGKHPANCPKGVGLGHYVPAVDAKCNCGIDAALGRADTQEPTS